VLTPGTQPPATAALPGTTAGPISAPHGGLVVSLAAAGLLAICCTAVVGQLRRRLLD
jgi:hypothetical protein